MGVKKRERGGEILQLYYHLKKNKNVKMKTNLLPYASYLFIHRYNINTGMMLWQLHLLEQSRSNMLSLIIEH